MANKLNPKMSVGTIGELFVQLRLLIEGFESFPPLKDSGNDLIVYLKNGFYSIQVKTKKIGKGWTSPKQGRIYDILALVNLGIDGSPEKPDLHKSKIWLITKTGFEKLGKSISKVTSDPDFLFKDGTRIETLIRELDPNPV